MAYVTSGRTERRQLEGHGFTFTIGRGNELCVAAIHSLEPLLLGMPVEDLLRRHGFVLAARHRR